MLNTRKLKGLDENDIRRKVFIKNESTPTYAKRVGQVMGNLES